MPSQEFFGMSNWILTAAILLNMVFYGVSVQAQGNWPELRGLLDDQSSLAVDLSGHDWQFDYSLRITNGANLRFNISPDRGGLYPAVYFSGPFAFAYGPGGWEAGYVNENGNGPLELAGLTLDDEPTFFVQLLSGDTHLYLGYNRLQPNIDAEMRLDLSDTSYLGAGTAQDQQYLVGGVGQWSARLGYDSATGAYEARIARHWLLDTVNPWKKQRFTEVSFYTRDSVKLYGNFYSSDKPSDTLVIILNGFGAGKDNLKKDQLAQAVTECYDALVLDFRGHGHSAGNFTGTNVESADIEASIRFARGRGYQRIILIGFSMGGSIALKAAALFNEDIDAVITVSAPLMLDYQEPEYLMQQLTGVAVKSVPFTVRNATGLRTIAPELAANLDVREYLPHIDQPILIIHGQNDWLIPADDAYTIFDGVSSELKQLLIMPGRFHSEFINGRTYDEIVQIIIEWLRVS